MWGIIAVIIFVLVVLFLLLRKKKESDDGYGVNTTSSQGEGLWGKVKDACCIRGR